jgi:hypothetical protein
MSSAAEEKAKADKERDDANAKIRKDRDAIINAAYYGKQGYGSIANTYKEAHGKDPAITLAYVQGWFRSNVLNVKHAQGMNSFVAPHPGYEYQMDLFFLADLDKVEKPKKKKKGKKGEPAEQEQEPAPQRRRLNQKTKDTVLAEPQERGDPPHKT